jgi:hypothetical protein
MPLTVLTKLFPNRLLLPRLRLWDSNELQVNPAFTLRTKYLDMHTDVHRAGLKFSVRLMSVEA